MNFAGENSGRLHNDPVRQAGRADDAGRTAHHLDALTEPEHQQWARGLHPRAILQGASGNVALYTEKDEASGGPGIKECWGWHADVAHVDAGWCPSCSTSEAAPC